uniref:Receptor ligand binding region domain-containing protein n=1 Tax=Nelumbo nucifera TaxID=4432 RepID=A0A822XLH4_NELNU|nr:TPA_asm: hypothetical protein HUJ06_022580 [Nelumbo nucifera]
MKKGISTPSGSCYSFIFIFCLLLFHGLSSVNGDSSGDTTVNIGAIVNANSRIGKEQKLAIEIAVQNFNNNSTNKNPNRTYKLVLHVRDSDRDPLQAASAADELINKHQVQAILGMETWQETALVAQVGNRAQVPVLSMATSSASASLTSMQWPFLVRMSNNGSTQMKCVADIVQVYQWKRVITISEDDTYGSDSGMVDLLSNALRAVGSEIEYRMALPPLSSLSDPKATIRHGLEKLRSKQLRVFILVQSSLPFVTHLFTEAKEMGLMEKESVWIITDAVTSVLDSVNSSVISSMQGVLGIKTHFSYSSPLFKEFYSEFKRKFRSRYPEEDYFEPGIYALRAHDIISTLTRAMMEKSTSNSSTSIVLLEKILSTDFNGFSGEIRFTDGELSISPIFQIVNVFGKSYKELDFWSSDIGFFKNLGEKSGGGRTLRTKEGLIGPVNWPGGLQRAPLGWGFPSNGELMRIGVPGKTSFQKFVKVEDNENKRTFTGFCIDIFQAAFPNRTNDYSLLYEFVPFHGLYDELVEQVYYQVMNPSLKTSTSAY